MLLVLFQDVCDMEVPPETEEVVLPDTHIQTLPECITGVLPCAILRSPYHKYVF